MLFLDEVPTIPFLEMITAIALMQPIGQILRFPLPPPAPPPPVFVPWVSAVHSRHTPRTMYA